MGAVLHSARRVVVRHEKPRVNLGASMLSRLATALSVRARLIVLSLVPVVGLAAIGVAYVASERTVEGAFGSVNQSTRLADASREFKDALTTMQVRAKEFVAQPQPVLVTRFSEAFEAAILSLQTLKDLVSESERTNLIGLEGRVKNLKTTFAALTAEQDNLGLSEFEGIQGSLRDNGSAIEQVVNKDLGGLSDSDHRKIMMPLMLMRRYEVEYRLTRGDPVFSLFKLELANFEKTFAGITATAAMKQKLTDQVKAYTAAFAAWAESSEKIARSNAIITAETRQMLPAADEIIAAAGRRTAEAAAGVAVSQARTKATIVAIGLAVIVLGSLLSWLIGRSITGPLAGLAGAMQRLASGDTSVAIPATDARDEIGAMARTVIVFRDNAVEREHLSAAQLKTVKERERRTETIAATIARFEQTVDEALTKVRGAATRLETASSALNGAADAVSAEARDAENRVGAASLNVTSAASSAEELATSISEIAMQAATSTEVAGRAVTEAQRTVQTMSQLAAAATRIGEVIGLIQAIAGQTNLLALNATIEAARAGEAGRGFAVVASEVKNLAGQTAKATEEVAAQIGAIQSAAGDSAQAIEQVNAIIAEMSAIAARVAAAVEEQNTAVATIAEGVNRASAEARSGAEAMTRVAGASTDARATSDDVKALAEALAADAEDLDAEVRRFLSEVRAA
jgi:methyl-accepting chemotaxis protein